MIATNCFLPQAMEVLASLEPALLYSTDKQIQETWFRQIFCKEKIDAIKDFDGVSILLLASAAAATGQAAALNAVIERHGTQIPLSAWLQAAEAGVYKGISVLWLLAVAATGGEAAALNAVINKHFAEIPLSAWLQAAEAENHKGISVLWLLAGAATDGEAAALNAVINKHVAEIPLSAWLQAAEAGNNKGISVLWLLTYAASNGHEEALNMILKQHIAKIPPEAWTQRAEEGGGRSSLHNLALIVSEQSASIIISILSHTSSQISSDAWFKQDSIGTSVIEELSNAAGDRSDKAILSQALVAEILAYLPYSAIEKENILLEIRDYQPQSVGGFSHIEAKKEWFREINTLVNKIKEYFVAIEQLKHELAVKACLEEVVSQVCLEEEKLALSLLREQLSHNEPEWGTITLSGNYQRGEVIDIENAVFEHEIDTKLSTIFAIAAECQRAGYKNSFLVLGDILKENGLLLLALEAYKKIDGDCKESKGLAAAISFMYGQTTQVIEWGDKNLSEQDKERLSQQYRESILIPALMLVENIKTDKSLGNILNRSFLTDCNTPMNKIPELDDLLKTEDRLQGLWYLKQIYQQQGQKCLPTRQEDDTNLLSIKLTGR